MHDFTKQRVLEIRRFDRFYTNMIGVVNKTILESPYSLAEARVLLEIHNAGTCCASELTELLRIDPGYLSRMVRNFKKKGLLEARRSQTDARSQVLSLTEKGKDTVAHLSAASSEQIAALLAHLPQGAQQQLVNHMIAIEEMLSGGRDASIVIRDWKPGDAGYIAYRHGVIYAQEYQLQTAVFEKYVLTSLALFLENPATGRLFIAECCGRIVGSIGVVETGPATAQLRWFLIEPEFRGSGLGRTLVTKALEYCRQKNYRHVFLWTFKGLEAARHLYEEAGFTLTEEKGNDTWGPLLLEQRFDADLTD